ncbi:siroheme synthase CysG [Terrarubrum flagellatum]|uniref:siroheme synthase CysG n=1 Tax=Terrirubrum flagellatum TaxID=2895980 RepID=UPI003145689E
MTDAVARTPVPSAPQRIAPLAALPVFHKLAGRKVVLAGAGEGAAWKAELLAATGARLAIFAGDEQRAFASVAADEFKGQVEIIAREWTESDLAGAAIAIAECDNDEDAARFAAAARAAGAAVNVIDRPAFCDFQFGAIVNRSPVIVSISTDGAAPVFGQSIRSKIEALLPKSLQGWAEAARDWRPSVQTREPSYAQRRGFWERFTDLAWRAIERAPSERDRDGLLRDLDRLTTAVAPSGRVTLVGAGPGDPELLTLKAVRALQSADVILYDDLVGPDILDFARREAKRMLVGKTGYGPSCKQDDINALMVSLARQGKHVVRLKGGDPGIFGRAGEEIAACKAVNIPVAIVPGVTSAQGAAASLGVSLTERKRARRVQYVTGHGADGKLPKDISWSAIADEGVTTVVYMPRRTLNELSAQAIAAGLDPATPAIAVAAATRPNEARVATTIAELPDRLGDLPDDQPVLVMIGRALDQALANSIDDRAILTA